MYYVYVLFESETQRKYVGYTSNLKRRIEDHLEGLGCKTTSSGKWRLVYYEAYLSESDARRRERRLKSGNARQQLFKRIASSIKVGETSEREARD